MTPLSRLTGSRARLVSLALLALGALTALVATAQPWWRLVSDQPDAPVDARITGSTASAGLSQVLPACVLVAALLLLVLRSTVGRRIVAVLAGLLALAVAVLGGWHPRPDATTVQQTLRQSSLADSATLTGTAWPWVYLAGGVLALAGAVLVGLRSPTWPSRADRYAVGTAAAEQAAARAATEPDTWWKAMDAGMDPTTSEVPDDAPATPSERAGRTTTGSADPISDRPESGATMAPHHQQHHGQSGSGSDR